ncbi:SelT/SelW/SelH family protein [Moritella marina ATCC 15381]|uniref:SelT/SelW/SelH family protein n=1 Tax=Moritella marina ATCC 15381 TaxID=1202962 RepID=A0A5J6WEY2_MORMI|nr:SelT/SelW/SelH family protein [Moritella marina]QFI36487.1 SelT/SelW/SelH family protein [Moritella marina ATCC 15381]
MSEIKAEIDIYYCRQCNWMLRSTWLTQELLHTFAEDISKISLHPDTGGRFEIHCNQQLIWERKQDGGFPEAKILKQRVRDIIAPTRDLGHCDRTVSPDAS